MEITQVLKHENGLTRYYFYDDGIETWVTLNRYGTYFDGTFKIDSDMTKKQIDLIHQSSK